jgi:methanethiol S-methyltransferase
MPQMTKPARPRRAAVLAYASAVYLVFLAVLGYAIGFFADRGVPRGLDQGARLPWPGALAIDAALLALFAVQHTVMARPWFKRRWTRVVPGYAERSTYVLCASLALALLFWAWRPFGGTVWHLSGPGAALLLAVQLAGWIVAVGATFTISHWDLFGVRQAWLHARGAGYRPVPFTERGLYARIRHPLMTGFLIVFWAAPTMTVGHLVFAAAATGYILAGIGFEERDLLVGLGEEYRSYRARVPALIPVLVPALRRRPGTGAPRRAGSGWPGPACRPRPARRPDRVP